MSNISVFDLGDMMRVYSTVIAVRDNDLLLDLDAF